MYLEYLVIATGGEDWTKVFTICLQVTNYGGHEVTFSQPDFHIKVNPRLLSDNHSTLLL